MIFSYLPAHEPNQPSPPKQRKREKWITYPLISFCTYRPSHPTSRQPSAIRIRCRDFTYLAFQFTDEVKGRDAYDSIKSLTCKVGKIDKLYAFSYQPIPPEKDVNGWTLYDAKREFKRMGISPKDTDKGWRISDINRDYSYSPTYPAALGVPSTVSDNVLKYGGQYRSKARIPALTYLHPVNNCSITRSSQPMVGMQGKRNTQDERLVSAIFHTSTPKQDETMLSTELSPEGNSTGTSASASFVDLPSSSLDSSFVDTEALESAPMSRVRSDSDLRAPKVYGATQTNIIVDARPTINAYAMKVAGMGSENMDHYRDATKEYLGIANIHVMRDSLNQVVEALKNSDYTNLPPNQEQLAKSNWLEHIAGILHGAELIARRVGLLHSHVLIHCSDGWDRTSQLSALSQMCLDPYYRTLEGFIVLVEKDWLSFGHMFRHRCGYLSSEKWFDVENERSGGNRKAENGAAFGSPGGSSNAFENALLSARGFFQKKNDSRESLADSDADYQTTESSPQHVRTTPTAKDKSVTKVKETSPVFHQFLDATYQLLHQHPTRFEFNERFLRRLFYHLYSCQYGTFLYNNEHERVEARVSERTRSVWDYFISRKDEFTNKQYDSTVDDKILDKERLLFPDQTRVRWWPELFGRTDEEMNGTPARPAESLPNGTTSIVTGIENADVALGTAAEKHKLDGTFSLPNGTDRLTASLASLGFRKTAPTVDQPRQVRRSYENLASDIMTKDTTTPEAKVREPKQDGAAIVTNLETAKASDISFQLFAQQNAFRDV
ncbi:phosphatidylinositol-3-phosphatase ymr1 [Elasticomyces elasticus]|nr:phosphatidylinositol-3-phosphatase ymr1 [Elasticomyces elasticus]